MMKKALVLLFALTFQSFIWAKDVCLQIAQYNPSLTEVAETSLIIEDELIEMFFSQGQIVSNCPAQVADEENESLIWSKAYSEAWNGGSELFIQVKLYFDDEEGKAVSQVALGLMSKASYRIADLQSGKIIKEETLKVKKPVGLDTEENVRLFAQELGKKLLNSVK